jgi:hypothetical protein
MEELSGEIEVHKREKKKFGQVWLYYYDGLWCTASDNHCSNSSLVEDGVMDICTKFGFNL